MTALFTPPAGARLARRAVTVLCLAPAAAAAQAIPAPPAAPPPPPAPPVAPVPPIAVHGRIAHDLELDVDRLRHQVEAVRELDVARIANEARWAALDAVRSIDIAAISTDARREAFEGLRAARLDMEWELGALPGVARSALATQPPAAWAQSDPADSLYRVAREALNRGEYRRAAALFKEIPTRFPKSEYAPDAFYWQAWALYRIGGTAELREALAALDAQKSRYAQARSKQTDVPVLSTRILGALAARGDASAQRELERNAAQSGAGASCDQEDIAVRQEALSALAQSDPENASQILRKVLEKRDPCSAGLRRRAVFLLGQRPDEANAQLLIDVARNDPDTEVRTSAASWLARLPGDRGIATLEELLRTSSDEAVQRAAVRALASSSAPRARQAVRATIERTDAPLALRREALSTFADRDRATSEDAAYLRSLYGRLDNPRLKQSAALAIARIGGPENEQWAMALVQNENEPLEARSSVMQAAVARTASIGQVVKLYDAVSDRQLREQLISILGSRKEPEATDKLLDIVRTGTDPALRRLAISALSRKDDPRTTKLLMDIISK
jgi:HEAT repeat protein